uniref:Replication termination factor 2 n=1 Tax=Trypanosoma vivax (strain Y486) TaxID=1055687 RepID=G0U4K0_TRYVY|nr:conserved hypothetical protein [Trypanosoma vivax Y486]
MTLEPLEVPIVFDLRGRLYSKSAVVEELVSRRRSGAHPSQSRRDFDTTVTRLTDVCEVSNAEESTEGKVVIRCPLTSFDTCYGLHRFVGFWTCGHVVCVSACNRMLEQRPQAINSSSEDDVTFSICPYCGESSFSVSLILGCEEDEVSQLKRLRPLQRESRKRKRTESLAKA